MIITAKELLWKERVAQMYALGLSQSAYARENGFSQRQVSYWVGRLAKPALPALLPVQVSVPEPKTPSILLRSAQGWTLTLPGDVPANWLAELVRGL